MLFTVKLFQNYFVKGNILYKTREKDGARGGGEPLFFYLKC